MSYRPTVAVIDLAQLAANFHLLKNIAVPGAVVCPMVKANAYGHGDIEVAKRLRREGAKHLGVALIEEGLHLRQHGDTGEILNFGMFDAAGAKALQEHRLTPVLSSREGLEEWIRVAEECAGRGRLLKPLGFHLKVNTGMNRLGIDPKDVVSFAKRVVEVSGLIAGTKNLVRLEGLCTHFSDGDDFKVEGGRSAEQMRRFRKAEREIRAAGLVDFQVHVANSSATAALKSLRPTETATGRHEDLGIRPGLVLYGVEPAVREAGPVGVKPALQFLSRISLIQDVRQGERVSYGGHWTATRNSRVGVVPCGYGDGYRRGINSSSAASNSTNRAASVLVGGKRVPVLGTICMDYFMCDLTEVQDANIGDLVTMIGESNGISITAAELAERVQTIPYEIFTGISARVPRVYVDGGHRSK